MNSYDEALQGIVTEFGFVPDPDRIVSFLKMVGGIRIELDVLTPLYGPPFAQIRAESRDEIGKLKEWFPVRSVSFHRRHWDWTLRKMVKEAIVAVGDALGVKCPHCGGQMARRVVRKEGEHKGKEFWGCVKYPKCHGIRAEWKKGTDDKDGKWMDGMKCPECGAAMAIRFVKNPDSPRYGSKFFGCTRYPDCKCAVNEQEAVTLMLMDDGSPPEWHSPGGVKVDLNAPVPSVTVSIPNAPGVPPVTMTVDWMKLVGNLLSVKGKP